MASPSLFVGTSLFKRYSTEMHKEGTSLTLKLSPVAEAYGEGLSDSVEGHRGVASGPLA